MNTCIRRSAHFVAPSNATPWYQTCTAQALGTGALSVGLDSIGLLPEGKAIEIGAETAARQIGNLNGYRGIVADQFGRKVLTSASVSAKGAASGISLGQGVTEGDWIQGGLTVAGLIPGLGQGAALLSINYDVFKTAKAVYACQHP
jgi:hypothetical protein